MNKTKKKTSSEITNPEHWLEKISAFTSSKTIRYVQIVSQITDLICFFITPFSKLQVNKEARGVRLMSDMQ